MAGCCGSSDAVPRAAGAARRVVVAAAAIAAVALAGSAAVTARSSGAIVVDQKLTEQLILGEIVAQTIERETGLPVQRGSIEGALRCDRALLTGDIDVYSVHGNRADRECSRSARRDGPRLP